MSRRWMDTYFIKLVLALREYVNKLLKRGNPYWVFGHVVYFERYEYVTFLIPTGLFVPFIPYVLRYRAVERRHRFPPFFLPLPFCCC